MHALVPSSQTNSTNSSFPVNIQAPVADILCGVLIVQYQTTDFEWREHVLPTVIYKQIVSGNFRHG